MPKGHRKPIVNGRKECTLCKEWKLLSDFHKASHKGSLGSRCKACCARRFAEWRANHPKDFAYLAWRSTLKRRYEITEEQFEQMHKDQQGVCAICNEPNNLKRRRLAVDHDHLTGDVRGLLCSSCNRGIGYFRDSPDLLLRAHSYLTAQGIRRAS